jgi:FdhD protein
MSESRHAPLRDIPVRRVSHGASADARDVVAVEEPLEIRLHDRPFVVIMRTPGADRELAAGFLLAEGIISHGDELGAVEHCRHPDHPDVHNVVNVFLRQAAAGRVEQLLAERRNVLANSSCGVCGRLTIDSLATRAAPLPVNGGIDGAILHELPPQLRQRQQVFDQTGGLHGAALFTTKGAFIDAAEDVGRHNAVDKVVGRMVLDERLPLASHVVVVSGRASFEIVQKAWIAGIEVICAVSAPSSLAIDLAAEAGITLVGFARERGFNVYTHPDRLIGV